jgi:hypothetical protein
MSVPEATAGAARTRRFMLLPPRPIRAAGVPGEVGRRPLAGTPFLLRGASSGKPGRTERLIACDCSSRRPGRGSCGYGEATPSTWRISRRKSEPPIPIRLRARIARPASGTRARAAVGPVRAASQSDRRATTKCRRGRAAPSSRRGRDRRASRTARAGDLPRPRGRGAQAAQALPRSGSGRIPKLRDPRTSRSA